MDGYIQSKLKLAHYIMERWFQARWSPVGGRCGRAPAYIVFCEPDPNYIRLSLCDKASHNKGGRPPKKKEVRAHGTPPGAVAAAAGLGRSGHQRNAGACDSWRQELNGVKFGRIIWTRIGGSCVYLLPIPQQCQISTEKNKFVK